MEVDDEVVAIIPAEKHKENGNVLYKEKNYWGAVDCYTKAINTEPLNPAYYNNRAAAYLMLAKYNEALSDSSKSCELDPSSIKAYIRQAKCRFMLGDLDAAVINYKAILNMDPTNTEAMNQLLAIQQLNTSALNCDQQLAKGDHRHALFCIQQCIDTAPGAANFKLKKVEILLTLKKYSEAKNVLEDYLQRNADAASAEALFLRGRCLYFLEHLDKAQSHFQHVLKLNPDHGLAQQSYKKCKQLSKLKEEGNEYVRKYQFSKAFETYTDALGVDPDHDLINAKLFCNRSLAACSLKRFKEALDDCNKAITLDSTYSKAYLRRVKCFMGLEQYQEAVNEMQKICESDSSVENRKLLKEAKLELKKSKRKDYYKILGIQKDANENDIKKAYKKRAMMHHPDRHMNAEDAVKQEEEKKFKEVGEAYTVLSDAAKKQRYDNGADIEDLQGDGHSHGFPSGADPYELFGRMFREQGNPFGGGGGGGFTFNFG